jgi:hypothetical protein
VGLTDGLKKCVTKAIDSGKFEIGMNIAIILKEIEITSAQNSFYHFLLKLSKKGSKEVFEFNSDGFEPLDIAKLKTYL